MKSISKIIKERLELEAELKATTEAYKAKTKELNKKIEQLRSWELTLSIGLDLDKIELGKKILYVLGNPYGQSDDVRCGSNTIAAEAIKDLLGGCKHLRSEYFGNKRYEGFYQRCDCHYGCGPSHGSIIDEIGLRDREKELTEDEIEAAVYYLSVWQQLPKEGRA